VSDAVEINLKVHEQFNSTFDESIGGLFSKAETKKRKRGKGLLDEFVDNDNIADIEESQAEKKLEDQSDYDGLALLFDESREDMIIRNIDEETLKEESKLPLASGDKVNLNINIHEHNIFSRLIIYSSKFMCSDMLDAFTTYQSKIPKIRRIFT